MFTMGPPLWGGGAAAAPISGNAHPFPNDITTLHHFDSSISTPTIGGTFDLTGASSLVTSGAWDGNSLNYGGTVPGGGGAGLLQSSAALAANDWVVAELTIECRVKMGGSGASQHNLVRLLDSAGFNEVRIIANSSQYLIAIKDNGTLASEILSIAPRPGLWDHFAMVKVNSIFRFFINGVLRGSYTYSLPPATGAKKIALGSGSSTPDAQLDELCITRKALWTANFTPPTGPYTI